MSDKKSKKINVSGYENKPRETTRDRLKFDAAAIPRKRESRKK